MPVLADARDRGMRLDVALVDRFGDVLALHHDVRGGEPRVEVSERKLAPRRDVRGTLRRRIHPVGDHVLVKERSIRFHRLQHVDHVGKHLVVHPNSIEGLLGRRPGSRGDRRHRVTVVERLVPGHDVAREVPEVHRPFADHQLTVRNLGKVLCGHHRLDPGDRERRARVDSGDPGMGVGAPQNASHEHPRHREVRAEVRAPRDLVEPVGPHRAGADPLEPVS